MLRTIGFERRQLAVTLAWQGTTIAAVGLVIGVPLGLVVGRLVWRGVAEAVGVLDRPAVPVAAVALVAPAALAVANLAAALPARGARRVAPAAVLRAG